MIKNRMLLVGVMFATLTNAGQIHAEVETQHVSTTNIVAKDITEIRKVMFQHDMNAMIKAREHKINSASAEKIQSKAWRQETVKWIEKQKLSTLSGMHYFTDSNGALHSVAIGVELCAGPVSRRKISIEMASRSAFKFLVAAQNGPVMEDSHSKNDNGEEASETRMVSLSGTLASYSLVYSGVIKDVETERDYAVAVYTTGK